MEHLIKTRLFLSLILDFFVIHWVSDWMNGNTIMVEEHIILITEKKAERWEVCVLGWRGVGEWREWQKWNNFNKSMDTQQYFLTTGSPQEVAANVGAAAEELTVTLAAATVATAGVSLHSVASPEFESPDCGTEFAACICCRNSSMKLPSFWNWFCSAGRAGAAGWTEVGPQGVDAE